MYFQKKRCIAMLLAGGQGSRVEGFDGKHRQACRSLWR